MRSLPPEIWRLILRNLPPMVLQDLYLVNSVFLDVAMDVRYHNVALDYIGKQLLRKLVILQNPDVARRVKTLRIAPRLFYNCLEVQKILENEDRTQNTVPSSLFSRMIRHLKRGRQIRVNDNTDKLFDPSIHMTPGALVELLQRLKNIHTFYLDGTLFDEDGNFSTIYLWPNIGQHLQDLTISVTSEVLKAMLPPPAVKFPRLRRLQIIIKTHEDEDEADLTPSLLATASFVNLFEDTLQHLSIQYSPFGDISTLYEHLGNFKHLWSVDIDLSLPRIEAVGGDDLVHSMAFLERHKHIIQNLSLSDIGYQLSTFYFLLSGQLRVENQLPTFYYNQLCIPRLHHLSIDANLMAGNWDDMRMFLKAHQNTLGSLEVVGSISFSDVELLLFHIREFAGSAMAKLSISTYRLDLSLLLKLAGGMEWLKVLKLEIITVAQVSTLEFITPGQFFPIHLPPDEDAHDFVREITACQELKGWNLCDIMIKRRSCCGELVLWRLMQFFATCIPTITSFAENGDMCIPEPLNVRPKIRGANCVGDGYKCVYGRDGVDEFPDRADESLLMLYYYNFTNM